VLSLPLPLGTTVRTAKKGKELRRRGRGGEKKKLVVRHHRRRLADAPSPTEHHPGNARAGSVEGGEEGRKKKKKGGLIRRSLTNLTLPQFGLHGPMTVDQPVSRWEGKKEERGEGGERTRNCNESFLAVAIGSFVFMFVSEYIVLWFTAPERREEGKREGKGERKKGMALVKILPTPCLQGQ